MKPTEKGWLARQIAAELTPQLKILGFRKKNLNWILEGPECYCIFNLQKSTWGDGVYFNAGVFIKKLRQDNDQFVFYKAPVYGRLSNVLSNDAKKLKHLMDQAANGNIQTEAEAKQLAAGLVEVWFSAFSEMGSLRGLQKHFHLIKDYWLINPEVAAFL